MLNYAVSELLTKHFGLTDFLTVNLNATYEVTILLRNFQPRPIKMDCLVLQQNTHRGLIPMVIAATVLYAAIPWVNQRKEVGPLEYQTKQNNITQCF